MEFFSNGGECFKECCPGQFIQLSDDNMQIGFSFVKIIHLLLHESMPLLNHFIFLLCLRIHRTHAAKQ